MQWQHLHTHNIVQSSQWACLFLTKLYELKYTQIHIQRERGKIHYICWKMINCIMEKLHLHFGWLFIIIAFQLEGIFLVLFAHAVLFLLEFSPSYLKFKAWKWKERKGNNIKWRITFFCQSQRNAAQSDFTSFSPGWMCSFLLTKERHKRTLRKGFRWCSPIHFCSWNVKTKPGFCWQSWGQKSNLFA